MAGDVRAPMYVTDRICSNGEVRSRRVWSLLGATKIVVYAGARKSPELLQGSNAAY